ncbi:MAG: PEP-CTERM sorting domain-containing protein [Planctomycetota bacterium]
MNNRIDIVKFIVIVAVSSLAMNMQAQDDYSFDAFIDYSLPGITQFDGWDELSRSTPQVAAAGPPFPGFPGATPWPAPIESVLTQDTFDTIADDDLNGDGTFNKIAGNGYPAGDSIYTSPFDPSGTFIVADETLVDNAETIVFQLRIGAGDPEKPDAPGQFGEWLNADPILTVGTLDNGTVNGSIVPLFDAGIVSEGISGSEFGPINVGVLAFQWDLRDIDDPFTAFGITFNPSKTSATVLDLRVDHGDTFTIVSVPEPASLALIGLGSLALLGRCRQT